MVKCCHGACQIPAAQGFPLCPPHLRFHHNRNKRQPESPSSVIHKNNTTADKDQLTAADSHVAAVFGSPNPTSTELAATSTARPEPPRKRLDGRATARKSSNSASRAPSMTSTTQRPMQSESSPALTATRLLDEPSRKKRRIEPSTTIGEEVSAAYPGVSTTGQPPRELRSNRETSLNGGRGLRETPPSSFYGQKPHANGTAKGKAATVEDEYVLPTDKGRPTASESQIAKGPAPVIDSSPKVFNQDLAKYWEEHQAAFTSTTGNQAAHERQLHEEQAFQPPSTPAVINNPQRVAGPTITPCDQRPKTPSVSTHQSQFSMSAQSADSGDNSGTLAPQMQRHLLRIYTANQFQVSGQGPDPGKGRDSEPSNQRRSLVVDPTTSPSHRTRLQAKTTRDVETPVTAAERLLRAIKRDIQAGSNIPINAEAEAEVLPVEERRRWLNTVDAQPVFDRLIYSQGAAQLAPPRNVHLPPRTEPLEPRDAPLFAALDPHIHWCWKRPGPWLAEKKSEIQSSEDRKGRFGMAEKSLAIRRRQEDIRNPASAVARDPPLPAQQPNGRSRGKSNGKRSSRGAETGHLQSSNKNTTALARMRAQFDAWDAHVWEKDKEQTRRDEQVRVEFPLGSGNGGGQSAPWGK